MIPAIYSNSRNGFFPTLFNDIFNDSWLSFDDLRKRYTTPAVNVSEDEKEYKVEVAAPGMTKEDFHIALDRDDIVISMEKKSENAADGTKANNKAKYLRQEFSYSKFEQRFTLPENIERQNISAQMSDGVLRISLPKMAPEEKKPETQYIEIQ